MRKTAGLSHVGVSGGMVDTLVLGASAERHGGSSPLSRTKQSAGLIVRFFVWFAEISWQLLAQIPTRLFAELA